MSLGVVLARGATRAAGPSWGAATPRREDRSHHPGVAGGFGDDARTQHRWCDVPVPNVLSTRHIAALGVRDAFPEFYESLLQRAGVFEAQGE